MVRDMDMDNDNENQNGEGGGDRLSNEDAARLAEQLADLARTNLPLPSGLRALGEEVGDGPLRRTLDSLARALERGLPLDAAIAAQGRRLPAHLRGLVQVGVKTGRIGEVLARFAGYANIGVELRRTLWIGLAYPFLALTVAIVVFVFAHVVLVNQFKLVFQDFGVSLPLMTRFLIVISDFLTVAWQPMLETAVGVVLIWLVVHMVVTTPIRRSLSSHLPLIGPVWRWTSLAEFCHLLGLLLEGEVSLPEAIPLAAEGVQDSALAAAGRTMAKEVSSGQPLSRVFSGRSVFPAGLGRILSWAEGHKSLPEAMHMAGDMFAARARAQASFAGTVLSVLSVLVILGGLGFLVPSLFLPLIMLIQKLSG